MNRILKVFVLFCFISLKEACNGEVGGGGVKANELRKQCLVCVEIEDDTGVERGEETAVEAGNVFMNEDQFSCLNDKCSKNEACISCLQGTQTNKTLCEQPAVKICHTVIKEVVSLAGAPSDEDYYSDDQKTEFFNSIAYCMEKGGQEEVTACAVKGCIDDKACNPCFMRVKMYCNSYGDEITDCVKNQFISNCVIIPAQG